jgi:hypothetical protein
VETPHIQIEELYVDLEKVIILLAGENIPIILWHDERNMSTGARMYAGKNSEYLHLLGQEVRGFLRNSPDYGMYASLHHETLRIFSQNPNEYAAVERFRIKLTPRPFLEETLGFLPMRRNPEGELVPVYPDGNE